MIASTPKLIGLLVVLLFVAVFFKTQTEVTPVARIGNKQYNLELALTKDEKTTGLSKNSILKDDWGMLFVFDNPGFHVFWMKDMRFPIDIIWIDEDFFIVDIERDVNPKDYPKKYVSQSPAQYVLEINAGQVFENGIRRGDRVSIKGL